MVGIKEADTRGFRGTGWVDEEGVVNIWTKALKVTNNALDFLMTHSSGAVKAGMATSITQMPGGRGKENPTRSRIVQGNRYCKGERRGASGRCLRLTGKS